MLKAPLAVAESCTGGRLSTAFTATAGCSDYFWGGMCTYANDAKVQVLGVPAGLLAQYGAVSEETARAMVDGLAVLVPESWRIAITGVAGPGGGSAEKPVGTVWIAVAAPARLGGQVELRRHVFAGERSQVQEGAVVAAGEHLLELLQAAKQIGMNP